MASGQRFHQAVIFCGSVVALLGQSLMSGSLRPGRQGNTGIPLLAYSSAARSSIERVGAAGSLRGS